MRGDFLIAEPELPPDESPFFFCFGSVAFMESLERVFALSIGAADLSSPSSLKELERNCCGLSKAFFSRGEYRESSEKLFLCSLGTSSTSSFPSVCCVSTLFTFCSSESFLSPLSCPVLLCSGTSVLLLEEGVVESSFFLLSLEGSSFVACGDAGDIAIFG